MPIADIIRIAEKYDRMHQLDLWVTGKALNAIEQMAQYGVDATLSVNLSGNTLSSASSLSQIVALVEAYQIIPGSLCFEITETAAIANIDKVKEAMRELRSLGCEFSLDDFGSGLSSFAYLQTLPVEYLKIDGSFVKSIMTDNACRAIVSSFNTLGHEMGMRTVAEFVENREIAETLTTLNIDYLQGYYVGMPRDLDEWLADYISDQRLTGT
jgi:Amt family ammonium transporter